ncbi:hypothetical protein ACTFIZ_007927 [Dictyostelium cf. discoideum]
MYIFVIYLYVKIKKKKCKSLCHSIHGQSLIIFKPVVGNWFSNKIQGDKFKVIWFHSRKLSDTQKRYSIGDREFLSIIDSLKKFQHLLIGKKVTIYTDHQNITYITYYQ